MKKYVTLSLFIYFSITVAILVAGLISYDNKKQQAVGGTSVGGISQAGSTAKVDANTSRIILSSTELAKHNSSSSCWLLISGKIYDVTPFLYQHPGNAGTILPTCGADATVAYDTKGGRGSHSSNARALLADYYIGDLNQTVTAPSVNPTNPPKTNATLPKTKINDYEND